MVTDQKDRAGRQLKLSPEQRRERARKAGKAAHSVSAYVRRIVDQAPALSADDIAALRRIIEPREVHLAYAQGYESGAKLTANKVDAAVRDVLALVIA